MSAKSRSATSGSGGARGSCRKPGLSEESESGVGARRQSRLGAEAARRVGVVTAPGVGVRG